MAVWQHIHDSGLRTTMKRGAALLGLCLAAAASGTVQAEVSVDVSDRPIFLPPPDENDNNVCEAQRDATDASAFGFALPTPAVTDDNQAAWIARFLVPQWQGQLERIGLPGSDDNETNEHSIPKPDQRSVITYNPTSQEGVPFKWDQLSDEQRKALKTPDRPSLQDDGKKRLAYLRGSHANEERNGGIFRDRYWDGSSWRLGDTVHSQPVIVADPPFLYPDSFGSENNRYSDFVSDQSDRPAMLYVGANDGMLHGFKSATGEETLAYIPAEDVKRGGGGGGIIFTRGNQKQLAQLDASGTGPATVADIVDKGKKDTKGVTATGPPVGDIDGGGEPDIVYQKTANQLRVIGGDFGRASVKLPLKGDKARESKTRISVGTFDDDENARIFYAGEDEKIYYINHDGTDFSDPQLAADTIRDGSGDGAQAIAGFGDIDGDGQPELAYADSSQDPHFLERCDMAYTADCPSDTNPGQRRFYKPGGTPGSNNGIGIGNLFELEADARGTQGLLLTDGSNNIWIAYPKPPSESDGARYHPDDSVSPHTVVKKGTQISDCGNLQGQDHCAAKSPLTAADYDGDGNIEIVFPGQEDFEDSNSKPMRALTTSEDACADTDADCAANVETVESESGTVTLNDETGVVAGQGGGGTDLAGASVFARVSGLTDPDYGHEYFVDGSPTYADAYFSDRGEWASVLAVPYGRGDQGVFAIDVTYDTDKFGDPEANADTFHLWTFDDEDHPGVGNVVNKVSIVRLANGEWAAAFGNGYGNTQDDGVASATGDARLYLVDIETGELLRTISTKAGVDEDPVGAGRANALGPVAPIDSDGDSVVDYIYAGDLFGNLWKFDVQSGNKASWSIVDDAGDSQSGLDSKSPLFQATSPDGDAQPITVRPSIINHPSADRPGVMIYFGTGVYVDEAHHTQSDEPTQTVYGLWDPMDATAQNYQRSGSDDQSELLEQTIEQEINVDNGEDLREISDNDIDWTENSGWFLDLKVDGESNRGERLVAPPQMRSGRVLFNSIIPRDPRVCSKTNIGWLMRLNARNGGGASLAPDAGTDDLADPSGVEATSGSATGGGEVYQLPNGQTGVVKSGHPGALSGDESQTVDTIEQPSGREATGRQYWRQLR